MTALCISTSARSRPCVAAWFHQVGFISEKSVLHRVPLHRWFVSPASFAPPTAYREGKRNANSQACKNKGEDEVRPRRRLSYTEGSLFSG